MLAVDLEKRIVPLLCFPRGEAPPEIPRQLRLYQYIDWGAADPGDETLLEQLVPALKGETILPPPSERKRFLERIKELPDDARAFDPDLSKTQAIDLTRRLTDAQFMGLHNLALYRQSGSRGLVRSWALDEIGGPNYQAKVILNTLDTFGFLELSSDPRERNDPDPGYDYTPLFWGYTSLLRYLKVGQLSNDDPDSWLSAMKIRSVFVSSVMQNYADRRTAALEAIRELGIKAVLAEDFSAAPAPPRSQIMQSIQECDALLGIYGPRYGWDKSQSGLSPTEEEYDYARGLWKPIYAFVDCMDEGDWEPRPKAFLEKVQNWDTGIMRNEFRSLAELKSKIKTMLSKGYQSPRCQAFMADAAIRGAQAGYREILETRLPAFDLLLHKPASGTHGTFDPHKLLAVVDGGEYTAEQIQRIAGLWKQTLLDFYKPSVWNQTSLEACIAVAVEANPHRFSLAALPWGRSASTGGYYGLIVDLKSCRMLYHDLSARDLGVKKWILDPILTPALAEVCKPTGR